MFSVVDAGSDLLLLLLMLLYSGPNLGMDSPYFGRCRAAVTVEDSVRPRDPHVLFRHSSDSTPLNWDSSGDDTSSPLVLDAAAVLVLSTDNGGLCRCCLCC